jgi:predicted phosphodiesterase
MSLVYTDDEFIKVWNELGSPTLVAQRLGIAVRNVFTRRRTIELRNGIKLITTNPLQGLTTKVKKLHETPGNVRRGIALEKGIVIVFSDAHFWPDDTTTAFKALLHFIKELKPSVIVNNGDAFDGGAISRFPRIGWDSKPTVKQELEACQFYLGQIEDITKCPLIWTLGNHDARYETMLANQASAYEGIKGFTLKDHFPRWQSCWSYWVNEDVCIKHRFKGGKYAGYNNALHGGTSIVTGHTHVLAIQPITDYNGTRYGVQTGTLAEPNNMQFADYTEDNPKDWRSGFAVLTWDRGELLMPELVQVFGENEVVFRGKIVKV